MTRCEVSTTSAIVSAHLVVRLNGNPLKSFGLDFVGALTVGRESSNVVELIDPTVSGKHALVTKQNEDFFVADLGSTNGTFVNGLPVTTSRLKDRDVIHFGAVEAIYFVDDEPLGPTPQRARFFGWLSGSVICLLALGGVVLLACLFTGGARRLSDTIHPWLAALSWIATSLSVLAFLPLSCFKETRALSGMAFLVVSHVFGTVLWLWSLLMAYIAAGPVLTIGGLLFAGTGVIPVALIATACWRNWHVFGELAVLLMATFGARAFGAYLARYPSEQYAEEGLSSGNQVDFPYNLVVASWVLFACSFVSYVGYLTVLPLVICCVILCRSAAPRVKRHGYILLAVSGTIVLASGVFGYAFADSIEIVK